MAEIKVRDLTDTSSVTLDNKLMVLTNSTTNKVQNITIEDYITNLISTKANNVLTKGDDNKLYVETPESITGELGDLTTTDKTTLVNAINEVKGDAGNLADLSNLTETGEERLHALKSYSDNGELLTDAEGLADVKGYAHSTYCGDQPSTASPLDPKKFVKVGSPVITDDGIASGFSSGNYLKTITIDTSKNIDIFCSFTTGSNSAINAIMAIEGSGRLFALDISDAHLRLFASTDGTNWTVNGDTIKTGIEQNTNYLIRIQSGNGSFSIKEYANNNWVSLYNNNNFTLHAESGRYLILGVERGHNQPFLGSTDLKQFSITVDGVPVFSGNETGIDTIKEDDYSAISSGTLPTISADGIASNFTATSFIDEGTLGVTPTQSWKRTARFKTSSSWANSIIDAVGTGVQYTDAFYIEITNQGELGLTCTHTGDTTTRLYITNPQLNTWYDVEYGQYISGASIYSYLKYKTANETNYTSVTPTTNITAMPTSSYVLRTGNYIYNNNVAFTGKFDLNASRTYVDGNLVHQPCLKIPYTLSKTGSKIVNSVYRDRVNDMAEQFGSSPYYTLSDTDFTLPQGELYGMIANKIGSAPKYDLGSVISLTTSSDLYTVPADGYILFPRLEINGLGVPGLQITINDVLVVDIDSVTANYVLPILLPVNKFDVVRFYVSGISFNFIPAKGV